MFYNIFVSTFSFFFYFLFKIFLRLIDSKCSGIEGIQSSNISKEDYFDLYIGPMFTIDIRFSTV